MWAPSALSPSLHRGAVPHRPGPCWVLTFSLHWPQLSVSRARDR